MNIEEWWEGERQRAGSRERESETDRPTERERDLSFHTFWGVSFYFVFPISRLTNGLSDVK